MLALHGQVAPHEAGQTAADGEAESGAAVFAAGGAVGLGEGLEEAALLVGCHADAGIADIEAQQHAVGGPGVAGFRLGIGWNIPFGHADPQGDLAGIGELEGVANEVG